MAKPIIQKRLTDNTDNRAGVIGSLVTDLAGLRDDKTYVVEVREETRTLAQNRYLHGVAYATIDKFAKKHNRESSTEAIHEILKLMFLEPTIKSLGNNEVKVYKTTTNLTKREFSDYIEQIFAWAAEFGCVIPSPEWDYHVKEKAAA